MAAILRIKAYCQNSYCNSRLLKERMGGQGIQREVAGAQEEKLPRCHQVWGVGLRRDAR